MKSSLIALLTIIVLTLIQAVTRLENYHYANQIGLCSEYNIKDPQQRIDRETCLHSKQTRNSWMQHLYAALTDRW